MTSAAEFLSNLALHERIFITMQTHRLAHNESVLDYLRNKIEDARLAVLDERAQRHDVERDLREALRREERLKNEVAYLRGKIAALEIVRNPVEEPPPSPEPEPLRNPRRRWGASLRDWMATEPPEDIPPGARERDDDHDEDGRPIGERYG